MQLAILTYFSFYLALAGATEPSVCKFIETKTPNEAYDFAYLFAGFRDSTDHLIQQKLRNSVVRSNMDDTVRFFTTAEGYEPSGFVFTVYIKPGYEREELKLQLDQFISLAISQGFNTVDCNGVPGIEIPLVQDW